MDTKIKNVANNTLNTFKEAKPEVVYLLSWTFPVLISNILNTVVYLLVNMIFVGKLGVEHLAAVSLGNTWTFCTSAFIIGSFNAMDTFISQGYGAKNYKLIGATIQRACTTAVVLSFFISIVWIVTEPLLILIHQNEQVAHYTQQYVWGMIPGLWFSGGLSILQKYLQGQGIMYPSIVCGVILNISNVILNFIMVHGLTEGGGIGIVGSALATSISKLLAALLLLAWIYKFKLHKDTWFGFSREELFGWSGLKEYLRLGIPAGGQMVFEGCAFEILTILSGTFGSTQLDGHSIAMNFTLLTFMLPFSISIALSVRIGQLLGSKKPEAAKNATKIGFCLTMSFMVLISLTQYLSRNVIGKLYSSDKEVQALVATILPISALFQFFDGFQTTCQGVVRGTGKNKIGAIVNFGAFYIIGVPSSCIFAFAFNLEVKGLWYGLCLGLFSAAVVLGIVVVRIDWNKEVEISIKRTETMENIGNNNSNSTTKGGDIESLVSNSDHNYDQSQEDFDRFNNEKFVETLGEAILLSGGNGNNYDDDVDQSKKSKNSKDYIKLNNLNQEEDKEENIKGNNSNNNDSDNDDNQDEGIGIDNNDYSGSAILC